MPRYRLNVDFDNSIEEFLYNGTGSYTFTVPASPNFDSTRYLVYLPAVLYLKDASKLPAITSYTRVEGRVPSTAEFRTIAAAQWDTLLLKDAIEFPAASAGATLTMTNYYTVGSTIDPTDSVDLSTKQTLTNKKIIPRGEIEGSSLTNDEIFTILDPIVPNVGDIQYCVGFLNDACYTKFKRINSTRITFYGMSSAGVYSETPIDDGGAGTRPLRLYWF
jgi:hypothetical protein